MKTQRERLAKVSQIVSAAVSKQSGRKSDQPDVQGLVNGLNEWLIATNTKLSEGWDDKYLERYGSALEDVYVLDSEQCKKFFATDINASAALVYDGAGHDFLSPSGDWPQKADALNDEITELAKQYGFNAEYISDWATGFWPL